MSQQQGDPLTPGTIQATTSQTNAAHGTLFPPHRTCWRLCSLLLQRGYARLCSLQLLLKLLHLPSPQICLLHLLLQPLDICGLVACLLLLLLGCLELPLQALHLRITT